jgi:putative transposase
MDDKARDELIQKLLDEVGDPQAVLGQDGVLKKLKKAAMERILEGEMTNHVGYEKHDPAGANSGNSRNGHTRKTVLMDDGAIELEVPRDRAGAFEPKLVRKRQRRLAGFDDKVIALYARGMTVRDIQGHLEELYEVEVSPDLISSVTDSVLDEVTAWQTRTLAPVWPIVYLDALVLKIRDHGVTRNKAVYLALGVNMEGTKEVLGLWIAQTEGAKFWLSVITELKTRGVTDILIACCDGLKGFPEAIESVFPQTIVQTCIVHMIRNSLSYVSYTARKAIAKDHRGPRRVRDQVVTEVPDDRSVLEGQLGPRDALLRVPTGHPPRDLHHERHRGAQPPVAQDPQDARSVPDGRGCRQAALARPGQSLSKVADADPPLGPRAAAVRHPLPGAAPAMTRTTHELRREGALRSPSRTHPLLGRNRTEVDSTHTGARRKSFTQLG